MHRANCVQQFLMQRTLQNVAAGACSKCAYHPIVTRVRRQHNNPGVGEFRADTGYGIDAVPSDRIRSVRWRLWLSAD